jgi:hypothetical protein
MTDPLIKLHSENQYFREEDAKLIAQLRASLDAGKPTAPQVKRSPITGEPMIEREFQGVRIDVCPTSGGVWLDAGELEILTRVERSKLAEFLGHLVPRFGK